MKQKINNLLTLLLILLISIIIVASVYYSTQYTERDFSQILYYLFNGAEYTSPNVVSGIILWCLGPVALLTFLFYILTIKKVKNNIIFNLKTKKINKELQLYPVKIISNHKAIYLTTLFLIAISFFIYGFGIFDYIRNKYQNTKLYEEYYVDGNTINIVFPEKKRNLIFISLESMETTLCSKENGGGWNYSIIPELEELALNNINFSNSDSLGGSIQSYGTHFTAAGLVAQTAGIPLITPATLNSSSFYYGSGEYLKNAYTLGDILYEQGYNLEIMMGSEGSFGGRTEYFQANGNYKIYDVDYAIEQGKMTEEERVWWGFEDDKLFDWSKEEILSLASQDKPFNYILQTADTHFVDGYLSPNVQNKFDSQYENVYAYSSKSVYDFVKWVQEQDFYDNTTIVIIGDHLGMQTEFYTSHIAPNYERTVYNAFINSAIDKSNTNNRLFCTMDFYPTILASLGAQIEGDRLGLGTNLFSGKKTLIEELGFEYFNEELKKTSTFYNNSLLGRDYYLIRDHENKNDNA